MTYRNDGLSVESAPSKSGTSHPEHTQFQQWRGKKVMHPNIEELEAMSPQEIRKIILIQLTYQAELEMQNEKLRRTIKKIEGRPKGWIELYDLAPVGYVTIDNQGFILEGNLTFANLMGLSKSSLINKTLSTFIIQKDQDFYHLFHKKLFKTGKSRCKLCLKTSGGVSFWVCLNGKLSPDKKNGKSIGLIVVIDIDKYKQAEKKLRKSRDNLSRILDNSPVVIYSKDLSGKYAIINKKFEELSGLSRREVIHKTDFELFPESVAIQSTQNDRQVIESAAPLEAEEIAPVHGKMRTFLSAKYPLINSGGKIYGICGFSMDIEKRKRVEDLIKASLKEKEILLKEIHHRVKNNMQTISSLLNLQIMRNKDERVKKALMDCQGRIQTMVYVHQMLYISDNLSDIDCHSYFNKLAGDILHSYWPGRHPIQLTVDVGDIKLGIQQALPLGLIINELLSNALKYGFPENRHGQITILLRVCGQNNIEFVFSDNGVGIRKDIDWRNTESLGLNLIVLLAENQIGGTIRLDREKGSCFTIRFSPENHRIQRMTK